MRIKAEVGVEISAWLMVIGFVAACVWVAINIFNL